MYEYLCLIQIFATPFTLLTSYHLQKKIRNQTPFHLKERALNGSSIFHGSCKHMSFLFKCPK